MVTVPPAQRTQIIDQRINSTGWVLKWTQDSQMKLVQEVSRQFTVIPLLIDFCSIWSCSVFSGTARATWTRRQRRNRWAKGDLLIISLCFLFWNVSAVIMYFCFELSPLLIVTLVMVLASLCFTSMILVILAFILFQGRKREDPVIFSVLDNFQNQRVNEEFWGVNSSGFL